MSLPNSGSSQHDRPAKVAIPRLNRHPRNDPPPPKVYAPKRPRVTMACRRCRIRKIRCNGARPRCANCEDDTEACVYDESRRNRLKIAAGQIGEMKVLLQDMRVRATEHDKQRIDGLFSQMLDEDLGTISRDLEESPMSLQEYGTQEEYSSNTQTESSRQVESMEEILPQQQQEWYSPMFFGQSSEIRWLRKLQPTTSLSTEPLVGLRIPRLGSMLNAKNSPQQIPGIDRGQQHDFSSDRSIKNANFYLDDESLDISLSAQGFQLPSHQTAERLLESYMVNVQNTLPILQDVPFKSQFVRLFSSPPDYSNISNKWLGLLNLVFAIGQRHMDLIGETRTPDDEDHRMYWSRAHILGVEVAHTFGRAHLVDVQITALLALYFLSTGYVNRAWVVMGSCVRLAHALGLHVNDHNPNLSPVMKESCLRTWWGLYALEGHLSTVVGQPNFVNASYCSVPLPLPLSTEQLRDESLVENLYMQKGRPSFLPMELRKDPATSSSSSSGSYFRSGIQLSILEQKIMTELYSATAVAKPWRYTLQVISRLSDELRDWLSSLPPELNFTFEATDVSGLLGHERLSLQIRHIAARILITRPCIESPEAMTADHRAARACVQAAKELASLMPSPSDPYFLYRNGPWWSTAHHVMQGLVVLLLVVSQKTVHFSEDNADILSSIKTFVGSLRIMTKRDSVAERAHAVAFQVLRDLASSTNIDISDLIEPTEKETARADETGLEPHSLGVDAGQWYAASSMEGAQASTQPGESPAWHNFYGQAAPASMFEGASTQLPGDAAGPYFAGYQPYDTAFSNPFMTAFGDETPDDSGERDIGSNR